ncbi:MAG: hypothetical protein P1V97_19595 [Planctomycetota bacterium]|nr:hypothetical protein [Planctomycetota bacterium]
MFESPAKVAVSPHSKTMSAAEQEALSKGEGRKLVVMFVLFVICAAFAVQLLLPAPKRPDNAPRGIPLTEEELMQVDKRFIAEVKIQPFVENENVEKTAQDFNQDEFEDDIFHYYIHKVHQSTDDELKAQFSGKNVPYQDFNDLEKIQVNRGKVQRLHGRILSYWQRVLMRWPNSSGLAWVWQAMVQTDDGIFMVVITDKDFEPEIGRLHGDSVEINAVFIKGYQYASKKGVLRMPLLAGRDFKRIHSATYDESYPLPLAYAMTIITLLMVFGGFIVHQYYKRADKSMREHRATLRRKRMERNSKVESTKNAGVGKESTTATNDSDLPKEEASAQETKTTDAPPSPTSSETAETASNPETTKANASEDAPTATEPQAEAKSDVEEKPAEVKTSPEAPEPSPEPSPEQSSELAVEQASEPEAKQEVDELKVNEAAKAEVDVEEASEEKVETTEDAAKPDSSSPDA